MPLRESTIVWLFNRVSTKWIKGSEGSDRNEERVSVVMSVGDERLVESGDSEATSTIDRGCMSGEERVVDEGLERERRVLSEGITRGRG